MKLIILVVLLIGVNAEDNDDTENFRICYEKVYEIAEKTDRSSSEFDIRTDDLPQECLQDGRQPSSCEEIYGITSLNGIYNIFLSEYSRNPIQLECVDKRAVIQRRINGSVDFHRSWVDYKYGFGINGEEFFIGLDNLHALTNGNKFKLTIIMESDEDIKEAFYSHFVIGNETEGYAIKSLGEYSGNAGDFLTSHLNYEFSTRDRNNDQDDGNCPWWYRKIFTCRTLSDVYGDTGHYKFLSKVTMMIGP